MMDVVFYEDHSRRKDHDLADLARLRRFAQVLLHSAGQRLQVSHKVRWRKAAGIPDYLMKLLIDKPI